MKNLPVELLELILLWRMWTAPFEKNNILSLRLVCKAFDTALKPYVFKTIQLEFHKFMRSSDERFLRDVDRIGSYCQAIYLDMMVVRDEEEIARLSEVFNGILAKVPEMDPLLESLRLYCMNERTFDEVDFMKIMKRVFASAPDLMRLKLTLPFQVVGRASSTATLLLATTLACLSRRPIAEDSSFRPLETLVIDHVSDTTVLDLCKNHIDVTNTVTVFSGLKNLVISIKRQETRNSRQAVFTMQLWYLIKKATQLESLCLTGWNAKRDVTTRRHHTSVVLNEWLMRSLPYVSDINDTPMKHLRYLELKRLDITPRHLVNLLQDNSESLEELYLIEVYLKVNGSLDPDSLSLWIGLPETECVEGSIWVADAIHKTPSLNLRILRVSGLGYDGFDPDSNLARGNYDLTDTTGLNKSFDMRFVEAASGKEFNKVVDESQTATPNPDLIIPLLAETNTDTPLDPSLAQSPNIEAFVPPDTSAADTLELLSPTLGPEIHEYDAETFQRNHNTTNHYKKSIDGYFFNHNDQALKELQRIIEVADKGMNLISAEIDRSHAAEVTGGTLVVPSML